MLPFGRVLEATEDIKGVATASKGVEAVTEARKLCPDVAVVDVSVPLKDASGDDLLTVIRLLHRGGRYFRQKVAAIARDYLHKKRSDA